MMDTYTITWRPEPEGDFFIQDYPCYKSASLAVAQWRRFWNLHETETVVFKVEKKESKSYKINQIVTSATKIRKSCYTYKGWTIELVEGNWLMFPQDELNPTDAANTKKDAMSMIDKWERS